MQAISDSELRVLTSSAVFAIASVCAVFVASTMHARLLVLVISTGFLLPVFGGLMIVRVTVGTISFFGPHRPPETRTVRAFVYRDKWMAERLKVNQPLSVLAFGAFRLYFSLALLGALTVAVFCLFFRIMRPDQVISLFVVGAIFTIIWQLVAGTVLLLRDVYARRALRHI